MYKIYTKTGDKGQTALFGGKRVSKSDLRVDAYGTVDELNAFIGFLSDNLKNIEQKELLKNIQERLFTMGANLASDPAKHPPIPDIKLSDIEILEAEIDKMETLLPPLQNFILPGGHPAVSACHLCRTICRRAERLVVALHKKDTIDALILQYLNRLSDYFFVLSRMIGKENNVPENIWRPREK
jgi:cob(I)alamin adenosyltransferase